MAHLPLESSGTTGRRPSSRREALFLCHRPSLDLWAGGELIPALGHPLVTAPHAATMHWNPQKWYASECYKSGTQRFKAGATLLSGGSGRLQSDHVPSEEGKSDAKLL